MMTRIKSIDIVRGIVMVIMALDHVRDLIHIDSLTQSPTDLATTTPVLFFTRFITHLCAPTFVFLAGTSAYISLQSKKNIADTRKHLLKRGLWLILLEFTVVNFGLFFDPGFHTLIFEVIASTGVGFIILGLLLQLPAKQIGIIGLVIIFCHNLVPTIPLAENSLFKTVLTPLFGRSGYSFASRVLFIGYPPIPWLGIMLTGFATGQLFEREKEKRKKIFIQIGVIALLLFALIRFINVYGDAVPWSSQKTATLTLLSFMNVSKYPPSLVFCLVTLGIMFLLLAFSEQFGDRFKKIAAVYGKVPLFYFIVHFYLIHLITLVVLLMQGFSWSQLEFTSNTFGRPKGVESGLHLWAIYLIWAGLVIILYKPCRWFGQYKATHSYWWLRYL